MTVVYILIGFVVFAGVFLYNNLVSKKNQVNNVFGSIDAVLKKRYDLIPNLVETVKQYVSHEKELLEEITRLRSQAIDGNNEMDTRVDLENQITGAMDKLQVAVENYPDLKANQNFMHLQQSMMEIEEQISAARRTYNSTVTSYNNAIEMFPSNVMANAMKYKPKKVFQISEKERQNVNMNNLFN